MFPKYSIRLSSKPLVSLTILAAAMLAGGCSDNSSGSDNAADDNGTTTSLSGKAADGYLAGARVCLDLNNNTACDDGEPTATTSAGGSYWKASLRNRLITHLWSLKSSLVRPLMRTTPASQLIKPTH
ncbi:MAG: hypothetical protein VXZ24_07080 [Pseudomonadota bacterium]|nr:hypothetical protein [Pseudomonadota bacterium]MEC8523984.1 hypothetical protein [Pseudomonadota bacterium]